MKFPFARSNKSKSTDADVNIDVTAGEDDHQVPFVAMEGDSDGSGGSSDSFEKVVVPTTMEEETSSSSSYKPPTPVVLGITIPTTPSYEMKTMIPQKVSSSSSSQRAMNFPFSTAASSSTNHNNDSGMFDAADARDTYGKDVVPIIDDGDDEYYGELCYRQGQFTLEEQQQQHQQQQSSQPSKEDIESQQEQQQQQQQQEDHSMTDDHQWFGNVRPKGHSFLFCGCDMKKAVLGVNLIALITVLLGLDPCFPKIIMSTVLDPYYYFEKSSSADGDGDDYINNEKEQSEEQFMSRELYLCFLILFAWICIGSYGAGIYGVTYWKPKYILASSIYYTVVLIVCLVSVSSSGILLSSVCLYPHIVWLYQYYYGGGYWDSQWYDRSPEDHWWNMFWLV